MQRLFEDIVHTFVKGRRKERRHSALPTPAAAATAAPAGWDFEAWSPFAYWLSCGGPPGPST
jgi:hypothetical protein